jgi:NADPH:quinone reductase-like Zn-dependent oxidoreductase
MQAVWTEDYCGPEGVRFGAFPDPVPGPEDLLVKVAAASVNPIDWKLREGLLKNFFKLTFPRVSGRDFSGTVIAKGANVTGFEIGDEVYGLTDALRQGTHATLHAVHHGIAGRKPRNLSHVEAASLAAAGTSALICLFHAGKVGAGQRVLIHAAAGGVGSLAVQMAKARGAWVAATCGAKNVDYVRSLGADEVIDYSRQDFATALKDLDVVFDSVGGETHRRSFATLKQGGIIAFLTALPLIADPARPDVQVKRAVVQGSTAVLAELTAFAENGQVKPQVAEILPLAEAGAAMEKVRQGHTRGKIVLKVE